MPVTYIIEPSPPCRSVKLVMQALDIPTRYKSVDLWKKEQFSPDFIEMNPLHTVPLMEDGEAVIWESHAIMTYLVSKYGKDDSLYPKDLQKRAIVDQRLHYSNDVFFVLRQAIATVVTTQNSLPEEQLAKIQECQENVEKLLEGHKFMAGDSLTLADYSYITLMDIAEVFSPTDDKFPATKAWSERCKSTMKDFDKANKKGADILIALIKKNTDL